MRRPRAGHDAVLQIDIEGEGRWFGHRRFLVGREENDGAYRTTKGCVKTHVPRSRHAILAAACTRPTIALSAFRWAVWRDISLVPIACIYSSIPVHRVQGFVPRLAIHVLSSVEGHTAKHQPFPPHS